MIKKELSLSQKIVSGFIALGFIFCLLEIFVFNSFTEPVKDSVAEDCIDSQNSVLADGYRWDLIPEDYKIEYLKFYVSQNTPDRTGILEFIVKDTKDEKICLIKIPCSDLEEGEFYAIPLNFVLEQGKVYPVKFNVTNTEYDEELFFAGKSDAYGEPYLSWGYASKLTIIDKLLLGLFAFLVSVLFELINIFFIDIKKGIAKLFHCLTLLPSVKILSMAAFFSTYFIFEALQFDWSIALKLAFSLIAFISSYWFENNVEYATKILKDRLNRVVVFVLSVWIAFSVVGNRIFLYPISKQITIGEVLAFVFLTIISSTVFLFSCKVFDVLSQRFCGEKTGEKSLIDIVATTIVLTFIVALYYIHAFNPVISAPDSTFTLNEAIGPIRGIPDYHPVFYIIGLKIILKVLGSVTGIAIVQFIFFAFLLIRGLLLLDELGISRTVQYATLLCSLLSCGNVVLILSVLKDVPYTMAITWLTITVARIAFSERKIKWFVYIELILSIIGTSFFRNPGIIPAFLTGIVLIVAFRKNKKIWFSVLVAFLMVFLIKGPGWDYLGIEKNDNSRAIYPGLGADILGVYYNGGEVPEEGLHIVKELSFNDIQELYNPYYARNDVSTDAELMDFVKVYMETFIKNPVLMTRSIMCRMDYLWDITLGKDGIYYGVNHVVTDEQSEEWRANWPLRNNNYFTEKLTEWTTYTANNDFLYIIDWRTGFSTFITIITFAFICMKKKDNKCFLLFAPFAFQILSLLLTTGWSVFRYSRPINFMTLFIIPISLSLIKRENED